MEKMVNELQEYDQPLEFEFTLRGSKNDSNKFINNFNNNDNNIDNNNDILGIDDNNFMNQNIENDFFKTIQINDNMKTIKNNNEHKINYSQNNNKNNKNKNYFLNNNIKNIIKSNKNKKNIKKLNSKLKNKKKDIISKLNIYWENRKKKNELKMKKIKKEREDKLYGELYPIPKINKNSKEIIERINEKSFEKINDEEQIEDEINNNIPIKTIPNNIHFRNNLNFCKNIIRTNKIRKFNTNLNLNINKTNTNNYKLKNKDSYANLIKLRLYKKSTKTPKLKKLKQLINIKNKNYNYSNQETFNNTEIKSLEKILKLRQQEKDQFKKKLKDNNENNKGKYSSQIQYKKVNKFKQDIYNNYFNINSNSASQRVKLLNTNRIIKKNNKTSLSVQNYSTNLNSTSEENTINELIRQRKNLNDIYNKDKRIINHSCIQSTSNRNNSRTNNQRKINIFYQIQFNKKSLLNLKKDFSKNKNKPNIKKIKKIKGINLYNENTKTLRYKHYTENDSTIYSIINSTSKKINSMYKENNNNNSLIKNKNSFYTNYSNANKGIYKNIRNYKDKNMLNRFNKYTYGKNNENNLLYKQNYKYNQYNKIQIKLSNGIKKFLSKSNNSNNNNNYKNIICQNKSIDNIFNGLDKDSSLTHKDENEKKINKLVKNKNNEKMIPKNFKRKIEESKNFLSLLDENKYKNLDNLKVKNFLYYEKQKIEDNLNYYNKELELNKRKKEIFLSQMYGNNKIKTENNLINNKFNFNFIQKNNSNSIDNNRYLIKNDENKIKDDIYKDRYEYIQYKISKEYQDNNIKDNNDDEDEIVKQF